MAGSHQASIGKAGFPRGARLSVDDGDVVTVFQQLESRGHACKSRRP